MTGSDESLDDIALRHGTGKASQLHDFTRLYEQFFASLRREAVALLEIGVADGASLKMWREYFPNARVVCGLDVDPECVARAAAPGVEVVIGDQNDRAFLDALARRVGGFDIVIDDGSHTWAAQITSFEALYPYLRPGGFYVVEDLHTSYWQTYAAGEVRAVDYFKQLVDVVNLHGKSGYGRLDNDEGAFDLDLSLYERTLESLTFFKSILFIRRRPRELVRRHFWHRLAGRFDGADLYRTAADTSRDGDHFVEVGADEGKSTACLAVAVHNAGAQVRLDVIDSWRGKATDAFDRFTANLRKGDVLQVVNPIRVSPAEANALYPDDSLDFVFLDLAACGGEVADLLQGWSPKVKPGKVLAGSGWGDERVRGAVSAFLGGEVGGQGPCWVYVKPQGQAAGRRVYDGFLFFNELELLEIRLHELKEEVDYFVLVESPRTHAGRPKPLFFEANRGRFKPFLDRIIHIVVKDMPRTATPYESEIYQRNAIARGLRDCHPEDVVLISDVDEIPRARAVRAHRDRPGVKVLSQRLFYYYFNTACREPWCGTRMLSYADFRKCGGAQTVRHTDGEVIPDGGWHFSFLGGVERIGEKLRAYSHQELASFNDEAHIRLKLQDLGDLFNRGTRWEPVGLDTLPAYLLDRREWLEGWFYRPEARTNESR